MEAVNDKIQSQILGKYMLFKTMRKCKNLSEIPVVKSIDQWSYVYLLFKNYFYSFHRGRES